MATTMRAGDTIAGSLAECFMTIQGRRYNFMQIIEFEATLEYQKTDVPILGRSGRGNKASGWSGAFSGTAHYNQSIVRQMMLRFKNTGVVEYFEIQVTNEDPTSRAGRQTVILRECCLDGGTLAKIDADSEYLDEDIEGTFDDFDMPKAFNLLPGM